MTDDAPRPRCKECFTRLRDGETQRDHELAGRCHKPQPDYNREERNRRTVGPGRYPI